MCIGMKKRVNIVIQGLYMSVAPTSPQLQYMINCY
jgi:hypothetical protein